MEVSRHQSTILIGWKAKEELEYAKLHYRLKVISPMNSLSSAGKMIRLSSLAEERGADLE